MDSTMNHPWIELQLLIKEKWLTQKAFATILWKKVSEVNELLKWKRNITIQWDYLLHQSLWTPIKYWILKQVDYDYSLLDIEESSNSPLLIGNGQDEVSSHQTSHSETLAEESMSDNTSSWASARPAELGENPEISPLNKGDAAKPMEFGQPQETPIQDSKLEDDEDLKNRANIFRSF